MKRVKILYRVYLFLLTKSFINIVVMLKFLRELRIFVVGFFEFKRRSRDTYYCVRELN